MRLAIREALLSFRRSPALSLLSVTTIAFALFVFGLFALTALNLRAALTQVEERVEIVMYLMRGTPVEVATMAIGDIESFPEVAEVTYVTEDQALTRARRELVELQGVFEDLTANPLPASLEILLNPGYRDAEHVRAIAERLKGFRFAEDVRYGDEWVTKLDRLRNLAGAVGFVVGGAFAMAAVIIIGTTIRMSVMHRQREIEIMRLVGATDGFIRRPFLLDGAIKGTLGGGTAILLCYAAFAALAQNVLQGSFFSTREAVLLVLAGMALGFIASSISVGRHLRKI